MSILLLSGGIDSLTLLHDLLDNPERYGDEDITGLFFSFPSIPGNLAAQNAVVSFYNKNKDKFSLRIHEMPGAGVPIDLLAKDDNPRIGRRGRGVALDKAVITSYRFLYFYTYAAMLARQQDSLLIYTGATCQDGGDLASGGYADCDPRYIDDFNNHLLAASCDGPAPKIVAPYRDMTKLDVARLGHKLRVPFEYTYSCEFGPERCNRCQQCVLCNGVLATVLGRLPAWRK